MDGFDFSELTKFEEDLLSLANSKMPKRIKKHLKKSGTKLTKVNKNKFKSSGAAVGTGATESEMLKRFKSGKVYKYNGSLSCRAYSAHPLAHLLDLGFIHKGGFKEKNGNETWIPGYHFMDKAEREFEETYYQDTQKFLEDILESGLS